MTLDLSGHLFGDRLDLVAEAMDAARTAALVHPVCTGPGLRAAPQGASEGSEPAPDQGRDLW